MSDFSDIYPFIHLVSKLKTEKRFSQAPAVENDTVASHCWRLAVMAHVCKRHVKDVDIDHSVKLALYHDIAEAVCGDIDQRLIHKGVIAVCDKEQAEKDAIHEIRKLLPDDMADEICGYWQEYEEMKTPEARYVKALDRIEGMITVTEHGPPAVNDVQHFLGTYGNSHVKSFPELQPLHALMKKDLKEIFRGLGLTWQDSYDDY